MDFVNDVLRLPGRGFVLLPALGVGGGKVHRHAALSVQPAGPGIGVGGGAGAALCRDQIVVIYPIQPPVTPGQPHALFSSLRFQGFKGFSLMARLEQPQLHLLGRGGPEAKLSALFGKPGAQVAAVVVEAAGKFFAVKIHFCVSSPGSNSCISP